MPIRGSLHQRESPGERNEGGCLSRAGQLLART